MQLVDFAYCWSFSGAVEGLRSTGLPRLVYSQALKYYALIKKHVLFSSSENKLIYIAKSLNFKSWKSKFSMLVGSNLIWRCPYSKKPTQFINLARVSNAMCNMSHVTCNIFLPSGAVCFKKVVFSSVFYQIVIALDLFTREVILD